MNTSIEESKEKPKEELGADGSPTGVELDDEEVFNTPFNADSISIESKVVPMDTLIRRLKQRSINLAPDFQRGFVWNLQRRSRLIESMMLKIPLPMFYVAATEKGSWEVVDGLQRLSSIRNFFLGENFDKKGFALDHLEFWGDRFNGKTFLDIESSQEYARILNNLMETELQFTVINPGTPEEVKRNIFSRINTGGMPLTGQEIRHALYQGHSTDLLSRLVKAKSFTEAINGRLDDSRMAARELILRFLAFSLRENEQYEPSMDAFLSDTMRMINKLPNISDADIRRMLKEKKHQTIKILSIEQLENRFDCAMQRGAALFMRHAFRKSCGDEDRSPINKALFESLGNVLADLNQNEFELLLKYKEILHAKYHDLVRDLKFIDALGRESTTISGVRERYRVFKKLIADIIGGSL